MGIVENIGRGLLGMLLLVFICYLLSKDRKSINWKTVGIGLALQLVLGIMILKVPLVKDIFDSVASFFVVVLDFTEAGADFVLGDWPDFVAYESQAGGGVIEIGYVFAFKVLPTIIFFSALSSLLYYLGILQLFIKGFAWLMVKTMGLTGAESLAAAANVFIGQTEAPLVVKPYLENMSRSEILCLMTGGMATIAGGVFAAYVGFLGGDDEVARQIFATHLLTASIMSAPAAIVAAKILLPESGKVDLNKQVLDIPRQQVGSNFLDAISRGTSDGIKLAVNVGAMLLVFTAFVSMLNYICFHWIGSWTGLNDFVVSSTDGRFAGFNIEYILGIVFSPVAWILGVPWEDSSLVGQLLGLKTTLNEFFAYAALEGMQKDMAEKSVIIATYALCGFANFASIGIQIGGISAIAPGQRKNLTELGITSLIGGTIACFLTAIIAGMMYTPINQDNQDLGFNSGVSQELSIQRAAQVSELVYDLSVVIPEAITEPVQGTMQISFNWDGTAFDLPLDFRQESEYLKSLRLNGDTLPPVIINDHIILPKKKLLAGKNTVDLSFTLGDLSLNRNPEFLYTLFVPDRASTAIPFFDQPDLKAAYRLQMDIPAEWDGIANGPLESSQEQDGRKVLQFGLTKPFSTYVFAFTAGKFQRKTATRAGREMHMLYRESDAEKVALNADEIFDLHAASIAWMEEYTGIKMPFQKFDFALLPGFQYGGMEHIGAIFYREASLFLEEDATTNQKMGRASLIAHETAHMWFGDMVTMRWFNDVWLKEVFANFMAAKIVNPAFPEINHDLRFVFAHQPSAYSEDRSEGSHPVQQELDNLKNAGTLYGRIIYQKAPIVMRQLETLVGNETFRAGLQEYLQAFAYGNATWDDLINILDKKTEIDLKSWSQVWVKEAGMPVYRTQYTVEKGLISKASIQQEKQSASGRYWTQLTDLVLFYPDTIMRFRVNIDGANTPLKEIEGYPKPQAFLSNGAPMSYGYHQLDQESQEYFLKNLSSIKDPLLRGAALMALEEGMLNGALAPAQLFDCVLNSLQLEKEPLNRQRLLGLSSSLFWRYTLPSDRSVFSTRLENILWNKLTTTNDPGAKSAYWSSYVNIATSDLAIERLLSVWQGNQANFDLRLTEARLSSLGHALAIRLPMQAETILEDLSQRVKNPDRLRRLAFVKPALSPNQSVRDAFFESLKSAENRAVEPWVGESLRYLHHPLRAEAALAYIRPSLELMEEIQATGDIFFPRQWISATLSGHQTPEAAQIVRDYLAEHPEFSYRLKNKVLMAADPLFRSAHLLEPQ
ncbi:MAG: hypothetical protein Sapg2KO_41870 [Saprospiraceae bacterium]